MIYLPSQVILVSGVGSADKQLVSFEMALRSAGIAGYNLVQVSSILPPNVMPTKNREELKKIKNGSIVHCVLSKIQSDENNRLISAAVGVAINNNKYEHGYLSEHHAYGITKKECGQEAEEIAKEMLITILNDKKEITPTHISESAVCKNKWTTVIAAAVLI